MPQVEKIFAEAKETLTDGFLFDDFASGINADVAQRSAASRAFHALSLAAARGGGWSAAAYDGRVTAADLPIVTAGYIEHHAEAVEPRRAPRRKSAPSALLLGVAGTSLVLCGGLAAMLRKRRIAPPAPSGVPELETHLSAVGCDASAQEPGEKGEADF